MRFHFKAGPPINEKRATVQTSQQLRGRHALVLVAGLMAMFVVALAYKWFFVAG